VPVIMRMPLRHDRALAGGLLGALAVSTILALARIRGPRTELELLLGSALGAPAGPRTWFLGFVIHLMFGAVFALAYAWIFERALHRGGVWSGILLAGPHAIACGLFLAAMPAFHGSFVATVPNAGALSPPGAFFARSGASGPLVVIAAHLAFGAIVGAIYGPVRRPLEDDDRLTRPTLI
jgi:hypothetical protein